MGTGDKRWKEREERKESSVEQHSVAGTAHSQGQTWQPVQFP